ACMPMEDFDEDGGSFEVVISSLAVHYVKDFDKLCQKIYNCMVSGGDFIFSVEHPVFTANASQDWIYNEGGEILHWPIDHYQSEGIRATNFLNEEVIKYHRTCASYLNTLIKTGFRIQEISEPIPSQEMLADHAYMKNELRRPMFLMIRAKKVLN
ncbi:MAG: methyltransferase domain-containing protein, partial [Turicibacter sp.]